MAEEEKEVMQNIDINEFDNVQTLKDSDYFVLSLFEGTPARVRASILKAVLTPIIKDGMWYIGGISTNVRAEGRVPELRSGALGIEYKYQDQDDSMWQQLIDYADIKLQFDALSKAQKDEIGAIVWEQAKPTVETPVNEAIEAANKATENANTATENANKAAEAANKYANRVKDITQEEWDEMEEKGTWEEGIEYNVYEV